MDPTSVFLQKMFGRAGYSWAMPKNVRMKKGINKNSGNEEFLVRRTEWKRGLDEKVETGNLSWRVPYSAMN